MDNDLFDWFTVNSFAYIKISKRSTSYILLQSKLVLSVLS